MPVILGDEELAELEHISAHLGSDTSKNAAVRFAILEWRRNRELIAQLQRFRPQGSKDPAGLAAMGPPPRDY